MNFKPTGWKIILSILAIILWYGLMSLFVFQCWCSPCKPGALANCEKVLVINIIPEMGCHCGCTCSTATPISKILLDLVILLFPGILIYFIWSLIQKKK